MTEKGQETFVQFYVVNPTGCGMATGLASSISVWISKDFGTCALATNTVAEVDSIPGVYELELTATEMNADYVTVCPACTGYFIQPVTLRTSKIAKNRATIAPIYIYNASTGEGITEATATVFVMHDHEIGESNGTTTFQATNTMHEVDATHAPGLYYLPVTATEMQCDRLTVYAKPTLGFSHPVTLTTTDIGALPVPDIDVTDEAYDCLRYDLDQLKARLNRIYAHLANWALHSEVVDSQYVDSIYAYDEGGTLLEAVQLIRSDPTDPTSVIRAVRSNQHTPSNGGSE